MKRRIIHIAAAAAGILALFAPGGCEKLKVESCTYIISPFTQNEEGGDTLTAQNVVAYAFFAETKEWEIASAEDAAVGVITNVEDGTRMEAQMKAEQNAESDLVFDAIKGEHNIFFIVYDRGNGIYAWRDDAKVLENLAQVNTKLIFRPWRSATGEGVAYTELKWNMVNKYVAPEPEEPEEPENPEPGGDAE